MSPIVVIGAGIAGTAAAIVAKNLGRDVMVLDGGSGASTLAPGALDGDIAWSSESREALALLGLYETEPALLATAAGVLRTCRARDKSLLDLTALRDGQVLMPRTDGAAWDADTLARSFSQTTQARGQKLTFVATSTPIARFADEHRVADADVAARHDDPERLSWLAERLREAKREHPGARAFLLPSWLGLRASCAAALSASVGIPCGETVTGPAGPSGLRFTHARDTAFARLGIAVQRARVRSMRPSAEGWRIESSAHVVTARAVIVATGGLVGGGIRYAPSASMLAGPLPHHAEPSFRPGFEVPARLGIHGLELSVPGSLFGESPESLFWPASSRAQEVGFLIDAEGRVPTEKHLYAAGDAVEGRARMFLEALESGARAARTAAIESR